MFPDTAGWSGEYGLLRRRATVKIAWAESGAQSLMVTHIYEWASTCCPKMARALLSCLQRTLLQCLQSISFVQLAPSMA
jgi:hypothetical protein